MSLLTMISVALMDRLIVKKAPRTASLAALETHCTDKLFVSVSFLFLDIKKKACLIFICAFWGFVRRWQQIPSRDD